MKEKGVVKLLKLYKKRTLASFLITIFIMVGTAWAGGIAYNSGDSKALKEDVATNDILSPYANGSNKLTLTGKEGTSESDRSDKNFVIYGASGDVAGDSSLVLDWQAELYTQGKVQFFAGGDGSNVTGNSSLTVNAADDSIMYAYGGAPGAQQSIILAGSPNGGTVTGNTKLTINGALGNACYLKASGAAMIDKAGALTVNGDSTVEISASCEVGDGIGANGGLHIVANGLKADETARGILKGKATLIIDNPNARVEQIWGGNNSVANSGHTYAATESVAVYLRQGKVGAVTAGPSSWGKTAEAVVSKDVYVEVTSADFSSFSHYLGGGGVSWGEGSRAIVKGNTSVAVKGGGGIDLLVGGGLGRAGGNADVEGNTNIAIIGDAGLKALTKDAWIIAGGKRTGSGSAAVGGNATITFADIEKGVFAGNITGQGILRDDNDKPYDKNDNDAFYTTSVLGDSVLVFDNVKADFSDAKIKEMDRVEIANGTELTLSSLGGAKELKLTGAWSSTGKLTPMKFSNAAPSDVTIDTSEATGILYAAFNAERTELCVVTRPVTASPDNLTLTYKLDTSAKLTAQSDIDEEFTWKSSNLGYVSVDQDGKVTPINVGRATITATGKTSNLVGSCYVTVRDADDVTVSPSSAAIKVGETKQLEAAHDGKDKITGWTSGNTAVATVSGSGDSATVTALKPGDAVITATGASGKTGTSTITVNKSNVTINGDLRDGNLVLTLRTDSESKPITASSDITETFTWTTSDASIAKVGETSGIVTGVSAGSADVTATGVKGEGVKTIKVIVAEPGDVVVTPASFDVKVDEEKSLTVTCDPEDKITKWASDKPEIATVTTNGKVRGVKPGTATITATAQSGKSTASSVTVNKSVVTLDKTEITLKPAATATVKAASDISESVSFVSDNEKVAKVNAATGEITALAAGKTNITATGARGEGTASCTVTVETPKAVTVLPPTLSIEIGKTGTVITSYDTYETVTWSTSDGTVATVKDGTVTAVKAGIAVITATGKLSGNNAGCTVTVTDPETPAPTPTPTPVTPSTIDEKNNPINDDEGVPNEVKPATPAATEATTENKANLAEKSGIASTNLVSTSDGLIAISPVLAKQAVEEVKSNDNTVQPQTIAALPIVTAVVEKEKTAALAFKMTGKELGAQENSVVSDITLVKVFANGTGGVFQYAATPDAYADEHFTLKDADGNNLVLTDNVIPANEYTLIVFIKDGGKFDLDKAEGSVIDPIAIATNAATEPKSGSSSSGCNGGFGALALLGLALVPMFYGKKR